MEAGNPFIIPGILFLLIIHRVAPLFLGIGLGSVIVLLKSSP